MRMLPSSLFSNARNLSTSLSGIAPTTGVGGYNGGGGGGSLETILRNTHAYTVSQYGKNRSTHTRGLQRPSEEGIFRANGSYGDALNLHEDSNLCAKELFARFRDDRELVQQF